MANQVIPVIQINEGDVGIGTATPTVKLDVIGAGLFTENVTSNTRFEINSVGVGIIGAISNTANDLNIFSTTASHNGLRFHTTGILPTNNAGVIIDADANLGEANYRFKDGYFSGTITAADFIGASGAYLPLAGGTMTLTSSPLILPQEEANAFKIEFQGASSSSGISTVDQSGSGLFIGANSRVNNSGVVVTNDTLLPTAGIYFDGWSDDEIKLFTSATGNPVEALNISSTTQKATFSGNVVIGAVDAVATGLNIGEASPTIQLFDTTNDAQLLIYTQDSSSIIGTYSNHALAFFTNSTQVLNLDTSQNATFSNLVTVGPGTTGSPYDSTTFLHVKGTTRSVVQQSSTDDAYYMFGDGDADNVAWLGYAHSSGNLNLQSQTSITLNKTTNVIGAFSASGNISTLAKVGIGTASPQSFTRLDVRSGSGNGDTAIAAYAYNGVGGVAISGQGFAVDNTDAGSATGIRGISNGGRTITGSTNIGGRFTASGAANNYAIITEAGNVGINNSTPTFSLDVIGTARVSGDTEFPTQSTTDDSTKVATTAFVKNILAEQPAGLTFLGNWNADTNSPTLVSGGGELASGSATSVATDELNDTSATFASDSITVNSDRVRVVQANGNIEFSVITVVDSDTQLTLTDNVVTAIGDTYIVEKSPFLSPEGGYYIVSTSGDEDLNGITDWVSGDWVLIATTNVFQKIDNTSILSGFGVENKIAKWAASSGDPSVTLSSSSITDTSTAVTIGVPTTITGPLTVNIDADDTVVIKSVGTNASAIFAASGDELYAGGGDTYSVRFPGDSNLALFDNENPGIAINTGNMNIGSDGPAADLTSFLNIVSTVAGVNPTINVSCDDADEASLILSEESGNQGYGARLYYQGSGDNFFNIQIGDVGTWTNRFTIERGGNVGIGLLDPLVKLQVAGKTLVRHTDSSWGQFAIANPSDAEVAMVWGAGGTGYPGVTSTYTRQWIAGLSPFSTGTDRWSLTNKDLGSTTAFTALETGGIGMGTYQPVGKLYVGPTWSTAQNGNFLYIKDQASQNSYDPTLTNTTDLGITYVGASTNTTGPNIPGLTLYNNSGVAGQFSPMILFSGLESGTSQFKATMAAIYARSPLGTGNGGSWIDGELIFATAGAATTGVVQRMVINKEGLVGIGTTAPITTLDIGGTPTTGVNIAITAGTSDIGFRAGSGNLDITSANAGVWRQLRAASFIGNVNEDSTFAGNVGIGTTSPSTELHVVGQGLFSDAVLISGTSGLNLQVRPAGGTDPGPRISSGFTEGIKFRAHKYEFYDPDASETVAKFLSSAVSVVTNSAELYHNNSLKLAIYNGGARIYSNLKISSSGGTDYFEVFSYQSSPFLNGSGSGVTMTIGAPTGGYVQNLQVQGFIIANSTVTATNFILSSDEKLKEKIKEIDNQHVNVNWKNFELKSEPGIKRAGVIAQELEKTNPEFVRTDDKGLKSVAYIDLLITKIAELEARLEKAGI